MAQAARRAEALGFASLWSGDHLLYSVDGILTAAVLGAATTDVTVGTAVYLPHLRPTVVVQRLLASIHAVGLADRFILGVGVGGDIPDEFEAAGVDVRRRGALLDESLRDITQKAVIVGLASDSRRASVCPPIWVGGRSQPALLRAFRVGVGFVPYLVTPNHLARLLDEAAASGRTAPSDFAVCANVLIAVDEGGVDGTGLAKASRPFGLNDEQLPRYLVTGSPSTCADELIKYVRAGANQIILNLAVPARERDRQLGIIAAEILPQLTML